MRKPIYNLEDRQSIYLNTTIGAVLILKLRIYQFFQKLGFIRKVDLKNEYQYKLAELRNRSYSDKYLIELFEKGEITSSELQNLSTGMIRVLESVPFYYDGLEGYRLHYTASFHRSDNFFQFTVYYKNIHIFRSTVRFFNTDDLMIERIKKEIDHFISKGNFIHYQGDR